MMAQKATSDRLIERLPQVRGRLAENAPLGPLTWFRVGGPAEVLFRPADPEDLALFIAGTPADVPVTVIGVGSNLLVRDGGIRGVVVRLGRGFAEIRRKDDTLEAGAGALDVNVALTSQQESIAGLEFLSGIPGTIGGALRMNAGAYGREMVDVTVAAEAIDDSGRIRRLTPAELGLTYRHSGVPDSWIFTKAVLKTEPGDPEVILGRIQDIRAQREASQPVRARTGGSTFANPPGAKAWELIDRAGCRGLAIGAAQVSEKHCNFLINTGEAAAADIERLGEEVRRRVKEMSGIELRWEIRIIGEAA
jgi:UDP-N-acetylmuramate dehydrogenase